MKFIRQSILSLLFGGFLLLASCSSDDNNDGKADDNPFAEEQYMVVATDSENSYLMTVTDIAEGSISPNSSNSLMVMGTPTWYFAEDIAAYGFIYRQGDPGTTQSFALNHEGKLQSRNEINLTVSIQSRAFINDKIYVEYSSRNYLQPTATFYKIDPYTQAVSGPFTINTEEIAGNGEYAYLTDIAAVNDDILVAFRTIRAGSDGNEDDLFASDFNDHTRIAVLNQDLELQKVITDTGRTGNIAGQFRGGAETGIEVTDNGNVYAFASALDGEGVDSGVLKLNTDTMEFDEDYFFNISEASGGYKLYRSYYVGGNTFVLRMFTDAGIASASPDYTRTKFAVVNVVDQTFDWVANVPSGILEIGEPFVDKSKKEVVVPIETSGYPKLYIINTQTAQMTEGLEIKAEGLTGVGKLRIQ